ncbi:MAG TPA: hypothetical protein VFM93_00830 [Candidatus Limnocylindria bacterium]|nr:hypothetical protein [Candidatus Limnocylindria bacterium]
MRWALAVVVLLVACGGPASGGRTPGLPDGVRTAPEAVTAEARLYTLRADLVRDVMPGPAPTPRRGVSGTIFLRADVPSDVPPGMRAGRAWLLAGSDVWETTPEPLQTLTVDRRFHLSLGVRDGPVWEVGSNVDVVLEFFAAGRAYLVRQRAVQVVGAL